MNEKQPTNDSELTPSLDTSSEASSPLETHHSELPPFSQQWVEQWKAAAPRLKAIRDQELRDLNAENREQNSSASPKMTHAEARNHGLAIQQSWFMRKRILDAANAN